MRRALGGMAAPESRRLPRPLRSVFAENREQATTAVAAYHGRRVRLFGSAARGDDGAGSDVDLLVDFEPGSPPFDLARLT